MGIRLSFDEFIGEAGITPEQSEEHLDILAESGLFDFFDISGGSYHTLSTTVAPMGNPEGMFVEHSKRAKAVVGDRAKVFVVGRIRDLDLAADVVTDTIETFTPTGIRLTSGTELDADIIISATGLKLKLFGGIAITVDGVPQEPSDQMTYKGLMVSGLPNFAFTIGYTNASWTLKADLVGEYVVRLLEHMDRTGARSVVPVRDPAVGERPFMDLASGYIQRALDGLPRQGDRAPWMLKQNYLVDIRTIRRDAIDDDVLRFTA